MENSNVKKKATWNQLKIFLLAHHPICEHFTDDVLRIHKIKLCSGCFLAIPFMILTFNLVPLLPFYVEAPIELIFSIGIIKTIIKPRQA